MLYLNNIGLVTVSLAALLPSGALAQHAPGVPAVAPIGVAAPPADLPSGTGPSGTSTTQTRFDQVGYAGIGPGSGLNVTGPGLPAGFVEVTDLATGRTALVKSQIGDAGSPALLVALSPAAARAIGFAAGGAVRVRQVDPIAADQVALDQGRLASPRLDAPPILLTGLRAQLAQLPNPKVPAPSPAGDRPVSPAQVAVPAKSDRPGASYGVPGAKPAIVKPAPAAAPSKPATTKPSSPPAIAKTATTKPSEPATKPSAKPATTGKYRVRVGAFSNGPNAKALAAKLGGHAAQSGKFWLVELGPFADAASAKSARDGAAKRGYGDARVITN